MTDRHMDYINYILEARILLTKYFVYLEQQLINSYKILNLSYVKDKTFFLLLTL